MISNIKLGKTSSKAMQDSVQFKGYFKKNTVPVTLHYLSAPCPLLIDNRMNHLKWYTSFTFLSFLSFCTFL